MRLREAGLIASARDCVQAGGSRAQESEFARGQAVGSVGYSVYEVCESGFSLEEILRTGLTISARQAFAGGFTSVQDLSLLKSEGLVACARDCVDAGFRDAHHVRCMARSLGFLEGLRDAGIDASKLAAAGLHAKELKRAGYSAAEAREAGTGRRWHTPPVGA